jgi:putative addiction module component (TIGR02574 family)
VTEDTAELLRKVHATSEKERATLAVSLMDSLDPAVEDSVDAAWNEEIARRVQDLDSGTVKTVPGEEVRRRISAKLAHAREASRISSGSDSGLRSCG